MKKIELKKKRLNQLSGLLYARHSCWVKIQSTTLTACLFLSPAFSSVISFFPSSRFSLSFFFLAHDYFFFCFPHQSLSFSFIISKQIYLQHFSFSFLSRLSTCNRFSSVNHFSFQIFFFLSFSLRNIYIFIFIVCVCIIYF